MTPNWQPLLELLLQTPEVRRAQLKVILGDRSAGTLSREIVLRRQSSMVEK